ncbi:MAG: ABC transporter substrate-binding protein [Peptoniphilaceae bacterium]|nr:ABC transporter substrate-binding protein [Peptoniphilaceae bacterium]MDD7383207.1 ABC transporter substrate-binding protein [Peptoniphilaceae bacterium]MDY3738431.1 ABC transporter substrate-binding protein [Peptoniphilaceae bacterium]
MKKLLLLLMSMTILTSCQTAKSAAENDKEFKISIVQLTQHEALDKTREGFEEGLEENGIKAKIDYQNLGGDTSLANQTLDSIDKDTDLVYVIATPVAQAAASKIKDIPILFNAVTDPVDAGLVKDENKPEANITGVSDKTDIAKQLDYFLEKFPDIKTIGVLFSTNEANSKSSIDALQKACDAKGIKLVTKGINNINDVDTAMKSLTKDIDGFFAITDNVVASSASIISKILIEKKIPSFAAEAGPVEEGMLFTDGVDYEDLGEKAAEQAKKIFDGEKIENIPVFFSKDYEETVNDETLEKLGLDKNLFD